MASESLPRRPFEILLVEDNPGDVSLTRAALDGSNVPYQLHVAMDGDEAVDFVRRANGHHDARTPDLILLDLNLPGRHGLDVLKEIRANNNVALLPVIILSTSQDRNDIEASYRGRANCYVTKPVDLDDFFEVIQRIKDFWLETVRLPTLANAAA